MRSLTTLTIAAMLAAGSIAGAMAQTLTETNSLEITTSGPYAGKTGTGYTDSSIYVASPVAYPGGESYGLLDFSGFTAPTSAAGISSLTVTLSQYTNAHAASGPLDFFLSGDTTAVTGNQGGQVNYSSVYDTTATDGISASLNAVSLGTANYVASSMTGTDVPTSYTFNVSPAASAALQNSLTAGDLQILVGTAATSSTEAQFDGVYYAPATVSFSTSSPVPEASTTVSFGLLLALGLGGAIVARRRKVTSN